MAGTYNAGTILLQVVPVFGDTQRQIQREVDKINKALGDDLEKGGAKAGQRAGKAISEKLGSETEAGAKKAALDFERELNKSLKDIDKALKPIKPKFESNAVRKQITELKKEIVDLQKEADKGLNPSRYKDMGDRLQILRAHAAGLNDDFSDLQKHDFRKVAGGLDNLVKRMDNVRKAAEIDIRTDFTPVERQLSIFEKKSRDTMKRVAGYFGDLGKKDAGIARLVAQMESLSDVEIGIEMDSAQFYAEMKKIQTELMRLSTSGATIDVATASAKAEADLAALTAAAAVLDGKDIDINADVNAGKAIAELGMLRALFGGTSSTSEAAANSFRSFNVVVLAAAVLIPGLIPMIGALGGALLGLVPILAAVGAAFGGLFVGLSGISGAFQALSAVEKEAGKVTQDNARKMRDASYSVVDARDALADAERSAAQAAEDSARQVARAREAAAVAVRDALARQRDAQRDYRDSINDVKEAEAELREARKRAREDLKADKDDNADKQRQNALAIRDAQLAAFDTTNTYNTVMADGSSTAYDKEAAEVAMLQARERLHELREVGQELAKEGSANAKKKVSDDSKVESAEDRLKAAIEAQTAAQEDLRKAADDVAEARVEGARRIEDAVRSQQRSEASGARSVAKAQEALRRAQEGYVDALMETEITGTTAMRNLEDAMGALGPAGREFAAFLFGLREGFFNLRREVQERMLPGIQTGLEKLIDHFGPHFTAFMADMGGVVGDFALQLSESLTGPAWSGFFGIMKDLGPKMASQFGETTLRWFEGFASILTTVAPWAEQMSNAMLRTGEAFALWAKSEKGISATERLMEYMARVGPQVTDFLGSFWWALINVGKALAPWGEMVIGALKGIFDWIAKMDPKNLALVLNVAIALVVAFQVAVGVVALVNGGMAILALTGAKLVFGLLGVLGLVIALGIRYEWLGDILLAVGKWILDHIDVIGKIVGAVLAVMAIWKTYRGLMAVIAGVQLGFAAATYGTVGAMYAQGAAAKAGFAMQKLFALGQWMMNAAVMGFPLVWIILAIVAVIAIVVLLWKKNDKFRAAMLKAWDLIKVGAKVLWKGIKWAFDKIWQGIKIAFGYIKYYWKNILWPVLDLIGTVVWKLWKLYFKVAFLAIKAAFKVLGIAFRWVWRNVLKPVFDAIVKKLGGKEGIAEKFKSAVKAIKSVWNSLKEIFATPIRFLIETVINKGIIGGFNKIADFVGSTPMKEVKVPGGLAAPKGKSGGPGYTGSVNLATGGILPGYTPGRDPHHFYSPTAGNLHLSGGEAVMRPEFTAAVGSGWIDRMNAAARKGVGSVQKMISGQAFAKGGVVWPTTFRSLSADYPGHTGVDISIPGGADYGKPVFAAHAGMARNVNYGNSSYGNSVWVNGGGFTTIYGHLSKAIVSAMGTAVKAGQQIGNVGSTGNSSGPHLHFEVRPGGTRAAALGFLSGAYSPSGGADYKGDGSEGGFPGWLTKVAQGPMGWAKSLYEGPIEKMRDQFGNNKLVKMATKPMSKLATGLRDKVIGILPSPLNTIAGAASGIASKALGALQGAAGHLGFGSDNGGAGSSESFARGGVLPYNGTMKYDSGGYLPPGLTNVVNLTGKPEPVFTSDQFAGMKKGGAGLEGFTYAPHFEGSDLTAGDVMDDLEFTLRKRRHRGSGKYN